MCDNIITERFHLRACIFQYKNHWSPSYRVIESTALAIRFFLSVMCLLIRVSFHGRIVGEFVEVSVLWSLACSEIWWSESMECMQRLCGIGVSEWGVKCLPVKRVISILLTSGKKVRHGSLRGYEWCFLLCNFEVLCKPVHVSPLEQEFICRLGVCGRGSGKVCRHSLSLRQLLGLLYFGHRPQSLKFFANHVMCYCYFRRG